MPSTRAPKLNPRRPALLAVAAALVATTSAGAVLGVFADQDGLAFGIPIHVETPDSDECPVAHSHVFCQVARSLSGPAAVPRPAAQAPAAHARIVCLPMAPERGLDRPEFLTACVVPRGPPLV